MERKFPERKQGAIVITKKDGQQISGELIAVKQNSLLLLDTEGKDVSIDITDIKVIRVVKKEKFLLGAGCGLLIGAGGGALYGSLNRYRWGSALEGTEAEFWGVFCGVVGLLIGTLYGAAAGKDKTIQIEGMTDSEIQETLDKLRKKARIRDYK